MKRAKLSHARRLLRLAAIAAAVVLSMSTAPLARTPPAPPYLDEGLTLTLVAAEINGESVNVPDGGDGFWPDAGLAPSNSYSLYNLQAMVHLNGNTEDNSAGNYFADGGALLGVFYDPRTGSRGISAEVIP